MNTNVQSPSSLSMNRAGIEPIPGETRAFPAAATELFRAKTSLKEKKPVGLLPLFSAMPAAQWNLIGTILTGKIAGRNW